MALEGDWQCKGDWQCAGNWQCKADWQSFRNDRNECPEAKRSEAISKGESDVAQDRICGLGCTLTSRMKGREEMRKISNFAILVLAVGFVLSASSVESFAQTDPYPNSVGIYFDEGAIVNTVNVDPPATAVAYLIATRYEGPGGVDSWYGGVSCFEPIEATIRGGGVNALSNGPDFYLEFDVSLATPLPLSSSIVLAELSVDVTTEEPMIRLFLEPGPPASGREWKIISSGGVETFLQPSVPCVNIPCYPAWVASVNIDGPVMSDMINWGEIKSLYR